MKAVAFEHLVREREKEYQELARKTVASSSPDTVARFLAAAWAGEHVLSDHPELAGVFE